MNGKILALLPAAALLSPASPLLRAQDSAPVKSAEEIRRSFEQAGLTRAWPARRKTTRTTLEDLPQNDRGIRFTGRQPAPEPCADPAPAPVEVSVAVVPGSAQHFNNILFELDSTRFANETSRRQVSEIAAAMKAMPQMKFLIEGHTCDLGDEAHNKRLSEQRADAVRAFLIREGVGPGQLISLGFGESDPTVENEDENQRRQNRRVVIQVRS